MIYNILLSDLSGTARSPTAREMSSCDVYKAIKEKEKKLNEDYNNTTFVNDINYMDFTGYFLDLSSVNIQQGATRKSIMNNEMNRYFNNYVRLNEFPTERNLQTFKLEYHRKFSLPAACILFVFLSFPIGLFSTRKSGKSIGFGIGLVISLLYWCIMFAGITLGARSGLFPFVAMWLPNIAIIVIASILFSVRFLR
jgi:lipopolysaccharide export system permease protein